MPITTVSGFNPTLVRLRLKAWSQIHALILEFQSHAGSIEAQTRLGPDKRIIIEFQSHAGLIEAKSFPRALRQIPKFQSHAGSIEASMS